MTRFKISVGASATLPDLHHSKDSHPLNIVVEDITSSLQGPLTPVRHIASHFFMNNIAIH